MPLQKSRSRRDSSLSTPWRFKITGWEALNLSATSCAWLNDFGEITEGLAWADTARTTDLVLGGGGAASPRDDGRVRAADCSATGAGAGCRCRPGGARRLVCTGAGGGGAGAAGGGAGRAAGGAGRAAGGAGRAAGGAGREAGW